MKKICRLCKEDKELKISHIVPKFIFKYQKKTSPTGYVRSISNPNMIARDGEKKLFLCNECEGIFSNWEASFAKNIFHPYQNGSKEEFIYEAWLSKYLASVSFRVLLYVYEDCQLDYFSTEMLSYVEKAIDNLRLYLLDEIAHPKEQRQLLLLMERLSDDSIGEELDFSIYLSRAIEFDVITTGYDSFIYIKYLKFLQLCPIKLTTNKGWRTARIHHSSGILKMTNHELPDYVLAKMKESSAKFTKNRSEISDNQAAIIEKRVNKNLDKVVDMVMK